MQLDPSQGRSSLPGVSLALARQGLRNPIAPALPLSLSLPECIALFKSHCLCSAWSCCPDVTPLHRWMPGYSKRSSSHAALGRNAEARAPPQTSWNQNLHFSTTPGRFVCMVKSEKHCCRTLLLILQNPALESLPAGSSPHSPHPQRELPAWCCYNTLLAPGSRPVPEFCNMGRNSADIC